MHGTWDILGDILILLAAALFLGTLAEQLRQSAILGYLAAGTLVGPNVLGLVREGEHLQVIAELGVALLLFTIGLEFSFPRLRRLGRMAIAGGTAQVVATIGLAAAIAAAFDLGPRSALAVGAMVALSSTACVLRVLVDRGAIDSLYGRNAVGILLLQDLAVIPLVFLLESLGSGQTFVNGALLAGRTALFAAILVAGFVLLFNHALPRLLNVDRFTHNRELLVLLAAVLALGSAAAARAAGLSPALGAFVAGVLLGESPFATQVRADVGSMRTILVTLFFGSVGMLGEPSWAIHSWYLVAGTVVLIVGGKALVIWAIARILGATPGVAAATGLCLAQVGEFSFVLAVLAHDAEAPLIDDETFRLIVSAMLVTLFVTPFLVAGAPRAAAWIQRRGGVPAPGPAAGAGAAAPAGGGEAGDGAPARDILIVGFGPAGQSLALALFRHHQQRMTVIDLNRRGATAAGYMDLPAHIGDASHAELLEHAGAARARVIAVTVPDPDAVRRIVNVCRIVAPRAIVIVRARYHVRRWELHMAGAAEVVDEEEQVGLRMAALARRHLADAAPGAAPGATPGPGPAPGPEHLGLGGEETRPG